MATPDISRSAFDAQKHYAGVIMQQGRITLDDDWNEGDRIARDEQRRTRVDVIGAHGSPDEGFRITNAQIAGDLIDFEISAGRFYLGGLALALETAQTYRLQTDFLQLTADADAAPTAERFDLVYLETWQQPVSAVEDGELIEVALGGPDTAQRLRTMQRVRVRPNVGADDCAEAWQALLDFAAEQGFGTLAADHQLVPDTTLTVDYVAAGDPTDLCTPFVSGGYLGAENQAIRVELRAGNQLTWGFDNAAPLYRVQLSADGETVTLLTEPTDQAHWPLAGQVVEILPWAAVLTNDEKLADVQGHLSTVNGSYDPDSHTLTLTTPLTDDLTPWQSRSDADTLETPSPSAPDQPGLYYYLRVWNRGSDVTSPAAIAIPPDSDPPADRQIALGQTGLTILIEGSDRQPGDHWVIAARPETPNQVVPWELESGRSPHGIQRFLAPLALIHWRFDGDEALPPRLHDCRPTFLPLTRLSHCCTYRVGDGTHSHGNFTSINAAIAALPPSGGQICVLPGTYTEAVVIEDLRNVTISGCGDRTRLVAPDPADLADPANPPPVLTIRNSQHVTVQALAIRSAENGIGLLVESSEDAVPGAAVAPSAQIHLEALRILAVGQSAITIHQAQWVTVQHCRLVQRDVPSEWPIMYLVGDDVLIQNNRLEVQVPAKAGATAGATAARGGLQICGTCDRVQVLDNHIERGINNGITLGSIAEIDDQGEFVPRYIGWVIDANDPCSPCKPGSVYIPPGQSNPDEGGTRQVSAGSLSEIQIRRNRITRMGLNGIGVIGFFDLSAADELVSVEQLAIVDNQIDYCLQRSLDPIPRKMVQAMGYGGIALADVEACVIRHNRIENNGPNHLEPICGIFILQGEGVDITGNHILNNGAKTGEPDDDAAIGPRGGIHIIFAVAPAIALEFLDFTFARQNGMAAANIAHNVVSTPLGQALALAALGPVAVLGNQLTTQGIVSNIRTSPATFIAATVAILNLGLSNEFYGQFIAFAAVRSQQLNAKAGFTVSDDGVVSLPQPGLDTQGIGQRLANGNVLFSHNQVVLDLLELREVDFALSSIFIASLDDISFQNNQCDSSLLADFILTQAFLFGISLRVNDNRFKEGLVNALFSAVTLGLMNTTTDNQSTHCLLVRPNSGLFGRESENTILVDVFFGQVRDNVYFCEAMTQNLLPNWPAPE
ncbi:DUF6519 domain-containing protein [Halomicronema sp. CCY15110]|uniref:DUF6519 domain-containing protein n=1 Tax=Halomicronema sp. CCY15110 TaxID=2767773 RepID=UPI001950D8FE|nr:DUF6519 domain-containing protein [Halomicronema sp. CCY15110]